MILVPAQFGWTYAPLFLQAIALRHRALVVHTGLPLCTIQREGGLACYLPGWNRPRVVGEPWARGPGLVELPLWVGRWNPAASRGGWALWGWVVGSVVLMMVGVYTGRGMRSRISSRT